MNLCRKFRERIVTEYVDGELDLPAREALERHLQGCDGCRAFTAEVKKNLIVPFENIPDEDVPEHLWHSIRERIEHEHERAPGRESFMERVRAFLSFPRLQVMAGSLAVLIVIAATAVVHNRPVQQVNEKKQQEYLAYLLDPKSSSLEIDNDVLGTSLEQYFL